MQSYVIFVSLLFGSSVGQKVGQKVGQNPIFKCLIRGGYVLCKSLPLKPWKLVATSLCCMLHTTMSVKVAFSSFVGSCFCNRYVPLVADVLVARHMGSSILQTPCSYAPLIEYPYSSKHAYSPCFDWNGD